MRNKQSKHVDELNLALAQWHAAMRRFDSASGEEVRFAALEVEAAKQKYIFLLNKIRKQTEPNHA